MKLTDLFIRRPVLAICVNLVILIAGLQAIRSLSVRQYPRSDIAVVQVSTVYVGANADLVRGFITTPLERVIAAADGIDYMESSSAQGMSTITVHLKVPRGFVDHRVDGSHAAGELDTGKVVASYAETPPCSDLGSVLLWDTEVHVDWI